ncbi:MAG: hypothetical protein ACXVEF_32500 [Polyangiales bacterium]
MRRWSLAGLVLVCGCDGGEVLAHVEETGVDAAIDTAVDAKKDALFIDGKNCSDGHDEDGDTIIDDCDTCPSVPSFEQIYETDPAYRTVGRHCAAGTAFAAAKRRVFFDPFTTLDDTRWINGGGYFIDTSVPKGPKDFLNGGSFLDSMPRLFQTRDAKLAGSTVVVTVVDQHSFGGSDDSLVGPVARVTNAPSRFVGCFILYNTDQLAIGVVDPSGCTLATCPVTVKKTLPIPATLYGNNMDFHLGLRLSVAQGASDGLVECRFFDAIDRGTLYDERYAISDTLTGDQWIGSGEIGFATIHTAQRWASIDVLAE